MEPLHGKRFTLLQHRHVHERSNPFGSGRARHHLTIRETSSSVGTTLLTESSTALGILNVVGGRGHQSPGSQQP